MGVVRWLRALVERLARRPPIVRYRPSSHLLMALHTSLLRREIPRALVGKAEVEAWVPADMRPDFRCSLSDAFDQTVAEVASAGNAEILSGLGRSKWRVVDGRLEGCIVLRIIRFDAAGQDGTG